MRTRKQQLGDSNIVGVKITERRNQLKMKQIDLLTQLQIRGIELTASGLSKLEGQVRGCSDIELVALSEILQVSVAWLLGLE